MNKVIISGADGFVGSYTTKYFLEQGAKVIAIDIAEEPKRLDNDRKLQYIACDISDTEKMANCIPVGEYDAFIHFAWKGSAGAERADHRLQMQNAFDTVACLKLAKTLDCKRFICAGSIMEYEIEEVVHEQGSRPNMNYIYGMGKHIVHCLSKAVAADIGIDLLWPMITNAYGAGESSPRFINTTLRKIINDEPLQFTSAIQNYDFVYVTDVAKAFYLIAEKGKPFCEYMIGSGNARPLKNFIIEMRDAVAPGRELQFGDIPYTGTNTPLETFDITDLKKDCGYEPEVSFSDGIKMTMEWMRQVEGEK